MENGFLNNERSGANFSKRCKVDRVLTGDLAAMTVALKRKYTR